MSVSLAILGGSGFARMPELTASHEELWDTPYGTPSAPLVFGTLGDVSVVFLPRHGKGHTLAPHRINYRANLWVLKMLGCSRLVGLAAVGGIGCEFSPGKLVVPDQIVDYTYGRRHTFFERDLDDDPYLHAQGGKDGPGVDQDWASTLAVTHVDFTDPYCEDLRQALLRAGIACGESLLGRGTYAATQGPRLETAAEIRRIEQDGCHIVGMTGMPEAVLARELDLCYACLAMVVNWAAGKGAGPISMTEIEHNLAAVTGRASRVIAALARTLAISPPQVGDGEDSRMGS